MVKTEAQRARRQRYNRGRRAKKAQAKRSLRAALEGSATAESATTVVTVCRRCKSSIPYDRYVDHLQTKCPVKVHRLGARLGHVEKLCCRNCGKIFGTNARVVAHFWRCKAPTQEMNRESAQESAGPTLKPWELLSGGRYNLPRPGQPRKPSTKPRETVYACQPRRSITQEMKKPMAVKMVPANEDPQEWADYSRENPTQFIMLDPPDVEMDTVTNPETNPETNLETSPEMDVPAEELANISLSD